MLILEMQFCNSIMVYEVNVHFYSITKVSESFTLKHREISMIL